MAMFTPNSRFMGRLVPAITIEAIVLAALVLLYVFTGQMIWIFATVAAGLAFAVWVIVLVVRHPGEWRYTDIMNP